MHYFYIIYAFNIAQKFHCQFYSVSDFGDNKGSGQKKVDFRPVICDVKVASAGFENNTGKALPGSLAHPEQIVGLLTTAQEKISIETWVNLGQNKLKRRNAMEQKIRIMPCMDMRKGRVVKGVHFVDIKDAGDPVECARAYCAAGADELALLDITATVEGRATMLDVVRRVAEVTTVPFTVGGGISDVKSAEMVLEAGADKISTSSAAFRKPDLIPEMIKAFGADKVTVAIDVDQNPAMPSKYEVYIDGGRTATGMDVVEWARRVDGFGVPVILPTSKAGDGARTGYDLPVIRAVKAAVSADVVASGGAGELDHFYEAVQAGASVLLAASVFHFGIIDIGELKAYLKGRGVAVS